MLHKTNESLGCDIIHENRQITMHTAYHIYIPKAFAKHITKQQTIKGGTAYINQPKPVITSFFSAEPFCFKQDPAEDLIYQPTRCLTIGVKSSCEQKNRRKKEITN